MALTRRSFIAAATAVATSLRLTWNKPAEARPSPAPLKPEPTAVPGFVMREDTRWVSGPHANVHPGDLCAYNASGQLEPYTIGKTENLPVGIAIRVQGDTAMVALNGWY